MRDSHPDSRPPFRWRAVLRHRMLLLPESLWFLGVSLADLLLTFTLLTATADDDAPFRVVEGNRVAGYILDHYGLQKLVYFKLAMAALVVAIAEVVATKKPATGRAVLRFGTLVVGCVVVYSLILLALAQPVA